LVPAITEPDDWQGTGDPADPVTSAFFAENVGPFVFFEFDRHTLTSAARQNLLRQAAWLESQPDRKLIIEGHADERGTREYNLALGARRAASVRDFLVRYGIGEDRIETISYGKERPISLCSAEACWSQNRRAVTIVLEGFGT